MSYIQSHAIYQGMGKLQSQAIALNNLGFVYGALGEYEKAIDFYPFPAASSAEANTSWRSRE